MAGRRPHEHRHYRVRDGEALRRPEDPGVQRPDRHLSTAPLGESALGRARALIDTRCEHHLDLAALSAEAGMSRFHFLRAFRAAFHETPHRYLVRRRIEKAKELLALSSLSVTDICFDVGFESLGSFSTAFHRIVGWPPSAYRARAVDRRLRPRRYIPNCCWVMLGYDDSAGGSNFREAAAAPVSV